MSVHTRCDCAAPIIYAYIIHQSLLFQLINSKTIMKRMEETRHKEGFITGSLAYVILRRGGESRTCRCPFVCDRSLRWLVRTLELASSAWCADSDRRNLHVKHLFLLTQDWLLLFKTDRLSRKSRKTNTIFNAQCRNLFPLQ